MYKEEISIKIGHDHGQFRSSRGERVCEVTCLKTGVLMEIFRGQDGESRDRSMRQRSIDQGETVNSGRYPLR